MTNEKYTKEFQKAINDYIKLGFNQDECNGFMHGFHKGAEAQQLIIADVTQAKRPVCPDCFDRGELRNDKEEITGTCPCHY
jgi:hypothetical protein